MFVLRPIRMEDLDRLLELAGMAEYGLSTLPTDSAYLEERIGLSERAFGALDSDLPAMGRSYLFVLEDLDGHRVVGTCGIVSKVGGFEPFYAYRIEKRVKESSELGIRKTIRSLDLVEEHDGPCEIGSLFLDPEFRRHGTGRMLSLLRFLFMAEYPDRVENRVIAELRGVVDREGRSPFWEAIGRHFFDLDFPLADYLSTVNRRFIAELMPRQPIYISMLPAEAQAVIGEVHEKTRPARKLLESQGFRFNNMVDIFEGGAVMACMRDEIATVRASKRARVLDIQDGLDAASCLIINTDLEFRGTAAPLRVHDGGGVSIDAETAAALQLRAGDEVRYAPLYEEEH